MNKKEIQEIAGDDKFKWFVVENFIKIESRISKLEVKATIWGAAGGMFTVAIAVGIFYIKSLS